MSAYRFWRLRVTATTIAALGLAEIEMRATVSGPDQALGKPIFAWQSHGSHPPALAVDGNPSTFWTDGGGTAPAIGRWIYIDFGTPVTVAEVAITVRPDGFREDPRTFFLDWSANGTLWEEYYAFPVQGAWTAGEQREFEIPDPGEAAELRSNQVAAYVWGSQPADELRNHQTPVVAWAASETSSGLFHVKSHQIALYAWVKGYVEQPHVRAWTFSLDGHDFYVLRLGTLSTVVFDLATGQWSEWMGHGLPYWRAVKGQNWFGMGPDTANRLYGTNVVAGDDRAGILWMLDPTAGIDDAVADDLEPVRFTRAVTGIVPMTMRNTKQIGGVYVTLSLGEPSVTGAAITLRTSDDWGKSYQNAGSITVTHGEYDAEIAWRSLGLIKAPGKIFELSDDGAAIRINYCELK